MIGGLRYYALVCILCHRRIVTCHSSDFSAPFLLIYRLSEPKPIEKWSTFIKINEESFSNLKKRFVIDGYGGFQDKARECRIEKLNFSFGVKHKKPEPPDFPNGRLFTVSSEDEWQIYQDFLFGEDGKEYELVGKFSRFCISSVI
mgnify:CR=1 FL=1